MTADERILASETDHCQNSDLNIHPVFSSSMNSDMQLENLFRFLPRCHLVGPRDCCRNFPENNVCWKGLLGSIQTTAPRQVAKSRGQHQYPDHCFLLLDHTTHCYLGLLTSFRRFKLKRQCNVHCHIVAPVYLSELFVLSSSCPGRRSLRSASRGDYLIPRSYTAS